MALILGVGLTTAGCGAAPPSRIAVATPDSSVAPSSAAPSRTVTSPAGRTGSPTSADAASSAAAAASASLQSIVDWKKTYRPPPSSRPIRLAPPPLPDAPILTVRAAPTGGSCSYGPALAPDLVVYADGRVITVGKTIGFYCEGLPTFRTGRADLAGVRAAVEEYLRSDIAAIDISHTDSVADGGLTVLDYTETDRSRHRVTADALDAIEFMKGEQREARVALRKLIETIDRLAPADAGPWAPSRVTITKPEAWVPRYSSEHPAAWPIPVTSEVRHLLTGAEQGCIVLGGRSAVTLLAAARERPTTAASWIIDKKPQFVDIGVVVDGLAPCACDDVYR